MSPAEQDRPIETRLIGIPLSPGVAIGRPCFFHSYPVAPGPASSTVASDEIVRLRDSMKRIASQRAALAGETAALLGREHAEIFEAHQLLLDDPCLQEQLAEVIEAERCSATQAVSIVLDRYQAELSASDSVYLQQRADDIAEIRHALLGDLNRTLTCRRCMESVNCSIEHCRLGNDHILIGEEIGASLPIETDSHTTGFIVDRAGTNSHAVILARALHRPVVGRISDLPDLIPMQSELLIDGDQGEVIINPSPDTLARHRARCLDSGRRVQTSSPVKELQVMANISLSTDVDDVLAAGAEGVGLYRTEMEMLVAGRPLGEDEQAARYAKVVKAMAGRSVYIRLLDLHHDKDAAWIGDRRQAASAPGRACEHALLAQPELLRNQARAVARASAHGPVRIVYPMISTLEQFLQLRKSFDQAAKDLPAQEMQHGVLFEVPAACLDAARIMQNADFGCIGTNDLIQYLFGMDRTVADVASHRALECADVLWELISELTRTASNLGKAMTVCGELASNPKLTDRLLRCGITAVSANPANVAAIRRSITDRRI
jgi:phosphotransferase system enzyme I (PtsI)